MPARACYRPPMDFRRRRWVALLLGVLVVPAMLGAAEVPSASPRPYLWRVERHGVVSHLFGTIHVGLDARAALGPVGLAALASSRRVFVEMDVTSFDAVLEF